MGIVQAHRPQMVRELRAWACSLRLSKVGHGLSRFPHGDMPPPVVIGSYSASTSWHHRIYSKIKDAVAAGRPIWDGPAQQFRKEAQMGMVQVHRPQMVRELRAWACPCGLARWAMVYPDSPRGHAANDATPAE